MQARLKPAPWIAAAFCAALCVAGVVLAARGAREPGTNAALAATGRLSFLLFWPAYAGGAMVALFGTAFQPLRRYGREFGLAFASAHLVHLGLVAWLCHIGAMPGMGTFIFFGIAVMCTYLLAALSFGDPRERLGPGWWWAVRTVALNYIAYAFAADFIKFPIGGVRHMVEYMPFAALAVIGPALRLTAFAFRISRLRAAQA